MDSRYQPNYQNTAGSLFGGGLGSLFGGLFGDYEAPFKKGGEAARPWYDKAAGAYDPYNQAGQRAIPGYEQWLAGMKDPSGFINNLMGQYQESPYTQYLKDQAMRSGINAASAGGTLGSTPFANEMAQQSAGIAQSGLQDWLSRVLGVNSQYGQGLGGLIGQGLSAAGGQANIFGQRGNMEGGLAAGQAAGRNQRWNDIFGGLGNMIGGGYGLFGG